MSLGKNVSKIKEESIAIILSEGAKAKKMEKKGTVSETCRPSWKTVINIMGTLEETERYKATKKRKEIQTENFKIVDKQWHTYPTKLNDFTNSINS